MPPCPTADADALLTDTSGQTAAKALREHVATPYEAQALTLYLAFMVTGTQAGQLDPDFVTSGLTQYVYQTAQSQYPSFFGRCGGSTTSLMAITSSSDFSCDTDCAPGAALFTTCFVEFANTFLLQPLLEAIPIREMDRRHERGKSEGGRRHPGDGQCRHADAIRLDADGGAGVAGQGT